ncbi:hypothetical protein PABG_11708 [Paracoccidioides brasiliensis Pb03]|nr:hypothetical protein PABG_11708 [Paracoccidioides brasiliensis Pb03]
MSHFNQQATSSGERNPITGREEPFFTGGICTLATKDKILARILGVFQSRNRRLKIQQSRTVSKLWNRFVNILTGDVGKVEQTKAIC